MSPELATRRVPLSGALAGAAAVVVFTAIHQLLISDIWYTLVPMMVAGAGLRRSRGPAVRRTRCSL